VPRGRVRSVAAGSGYVIALYIFGRAIVSIITTAMLPNAQTSTSPSTTFDAVTEAL